MTGSCVRAWVEWDRAWEGSGRGEQGARKRQRERNPKEASCLLTKHASHYAIINLPLKKGVDCVSACYGSTAALFNAHQWLTSTAWDGRLLAIVVATDVAAYEKGPARPTGDHCTRLLALACVGMRAWMRRCQQSAHGLQLGVQRAPVTPARSPNTLPIGLCLLRVCRRRRRCGDAAWPARTPGAGAARAGGVRGRRRRLLQARVAVPSGAPALPALPSFGCWP